MSGHMIEWTEISATLKNTGIQLVASGPDDETAKEFIYSDDIRTLYGCSSIAFMEQYGDNEETLFELFFSVHGIAVNNN